MAGKFNLAEHFTRGAVATQVRDIDAITDEILCAKRAGGEAIITIGRGLIEAKSQLPHGEWLSWLTERIEFSERSAQNFMRLAREWTNPQTLADLGASKALTLLALPEDERNAFIASTHMVGGEEKTTSEMTSKELIQAIKERDDARMDAERAVAERNAADAARDEMSRQLEQAKTELTELRNRPVDIAVEKVVDQEAIERAKADVSARMQKKVDKAQAEKAAAEAALAAASKKLEDLSKIEKKTVLAADKDLATFEVFFAQAQENINKMRGILLKVRMRDQDAAARLEEAIRTLAEAVGRCAD